MNRPLRILYFDHTAALGGGEIALLNLVEALDRHRFEPVLVLASPGPLVDKFQTIGLQPHVMSLASEVTQTRKGSLGIGSILKVGLIFKMLLYIWNLRGFIAKQRVDVVHTNSLKADIIGGLAAWLAGVPVVWHVRDRITDDYLPPKVVVIFRWLLRVVPQRVIANSQATLDTLCLPPTKKADVVSSGVVSQCENPAINVAERLAAGAPLIGIVGRISPWKGQHIFLRAAAMVKERYPNARFQIIGSALFDEADYEREIHALTTSLGLDGAVEFTGFRPNVSQLMAQLDIVAHASTTGEPFGQVVAEGMLAGKPVVATNGGGVPEIIENGVSGLLVTMGDAAALGTAMLWLLDHPAEAEKIATAGRCRILDHFTIKQTVRKVQTIYSEMLCPA